MYHLDNTSGVPEMPEPKDTQSISPRWFGESQEQGGISWPGADWFNIIQAELLAILELDDETPDKARFDQLATTIKRFSGIPYGTGRVRDGVTFLTPELFGAVGDGISDDSDAIISALQLASTLKIKGVFLGKSYAISKTLEIPSGVCLYGNGAGTGLVLPITPDALLFRMISMAGTKSACRDFYISYNVAGKGSIAAVSTYGVYFESTSSYCKALNLNIVGKHNDSLMGFSNGIRVTGSHNEVHDCQVIYATMGMTLRGDGHTINRNYCSNHFVDENLDIWNSFSPYWDGITAEGLTYSKITNNICEYNGQSGIYMGGNGSLSHSNLLAGNDCRRNFNRGIDLGVSGTQTAENNVYKLRVANNHVIDNHSVGLWLYSADDCIVMGNICELTPDYESIFGNMSGQSNRQALAVAADNCVVSSNRIYATSNDNFSYSVSGNNTIFDDTNFVSLGATNYVNQIMQNQKFKNYSGTFTPVIRAGSTGLSLDKAFGSYVINDNRVTYKIDVIISGKSASGNLYIGTLAAISGKVILDQCVTIGYYSAFNNKFTNDSTLCAYIPVDNPDQVCISRKVGPATINDIPSCIDSGTRIRLTIDATISTTATPDNSPGISLFGHSFLSEQGLGNAIGEALGRRLYNFSRGGSSSTEAALMFGAITHSYAPVGGVIPASGAVELTPHEDGVWWGGAWAYVTLAGIQGIINATSVSGVTTKLTFTRITAGNAVAVPNPVPMVVLPWVRQSSWSTKYLTEHATYRNDIVIIQCLRNNSSWKTGLSDIAAIVSSLGSSRFIVLPEFPYSSETTGTAGANTVLSYNARLKSTYPNNYCQIDGVDLLENFKNHHNPNYEQDVSDISNGVTPSSLRYDSLHPSRFIQENALYSGVQVNADFIVKFIRNKGWF
ncbi:right-handed parallel beta-helix repeat-containing protein [Serratia fonticola]|uniref:hypothetical protein n=1 Tax=Serratia fonticola TaxID=47917 RepID=UPI003AB02FD8